MDSAMDNESVIASWSTYPLDLVDDKGDSGKREMLNPALFSVLGDLSGRSLLDAGCGNGYLARMMAAQGATVVGVEPADSLYLYAVAREAKNPLGIRYVQADLCDLLEPGVRPEIGGPFDVVVASMVFLNIPSWQPAMAACARSLKTGGQFVFSLEHPCWVPGSVDV